MEREEYHIHLRVETLDDAHKIIEHLEKQTGRKLETTYRTQCDGCLKTVPDDSDKFTCLKCGILYDLCEKCQKTEDHSECPAGWGCSE